MFRISSIFLLILFTMVSCSKAPSSDKKKMVLNYFEQINSDSHSDSLKLQYVDNLYNFLIHDKNDSVNRSLLFSVIRQYFILNQNEAYLQASKKIYQFSSSDNDTLQMAKSLCYIGDYFENNTQLDSAFKYYSKSEKLYRIIDEHSGIGKSTLYKSGILYDAGIYTESEVQTANAMYYLKRDGNQRLLYESYNLMGLNLSELGDYEKALLYFNLAREQLDAMKKNNYSEDKLIKSRASIYNNIGNLFEKKADFTSAILFYTKGLASHKIKENQPTLYAMLLDNLANAKMKSGALKDVERLLLESAKIRARLQIKSGIVTGVIHLGEYYIAAKDTIKGLNLLTDGYKKAKEIESTYDVKNALKLLSLNDKENRDYYNKLYISITDSLQNIERNTRNKFARIAYETEQIEEKNDTLIKKYTSTVLLFSSALLLVSVIFIIYRLKSRNRELHYIKNQQESNEKIYQLILEQQHENQSARLEERNRIALELHDGIVNRVFATRFNLTLLQSGASDQKAQLVQELIIVEEEIRKVSHDLQQNSAFEDTSFQKALESLVLNQTNAMNTQFDCSIDNYIDWSVIPSAYKVPIYRIVQEALHNVNKYAQATKCFVFLLKKGSKISLQIADNGIGFETEKKSQGIGLKNIQQRVESINGTYTISSDSSGTTIEILF